MTSPNTDQKNKKNARKINPLKDNMFAFEKIFFRNFEKMSSLKYRNFYVFFRVFLDFGDQTIQMA